MSCIENCDIREGAPMPSARSSANKPTGNTNRLHPEDEAVHGWYRFVLSFPAHLVREYLSRFEVGPTGLVLDPFCGTGTVLVECKKMGIPSIGVEAHPMPHFASQVKVDWDVDPDGLRRCADEVADAARAELEADGIDDLLTLRPPRMAPPKLTGLPAESWKLLLKGSISPLPLHKTLVLRECVRRHEQRRHQPHQLLALASALPTSIGNLRFGPEVGVTSPKPDSPVIAPWLERVRRMAADLRGMNSRHCASAEVHRADARRPVEILAPASISAVITSPPYPNEKDYTRITRLESVILGFISSRSELRELKQQLMRSNTRNVYKGDKDDLYVAGHREVERLAEQIEETRAQLRKTSGFERLYASVTRHYFGGMKCHLAELRQCLRPGARLAYVVGDQASYFRVMIRTGQLLADIAQSLGYRVLGRELFRTRLATATREQLREEVLMLEWPGR